MTTSYITCWIKKEEAQAKVRQLIADGVYKKGEIKLSSYRWADTKDHSKGYLARVYVVSGIHPELELGETGRRKKQESAPVPMVHVKIHFENCALECGQSAGIITHECDIPLENAELLKNDPDDQGKELAISIAEDLHITSFCNYRVVDCDYVVVE